MRSSKQFYVRKILCFPPINITGMSRTRVLKRFMDPVMRPVLPTHTFLLVSSLRTTLDTPLGK